MQCDNCSILSENTKGELSVDVDRGVDEIKAESEEKEKDASGANSQMEKVNDKDPKISQCFIRDEDLQDFLLYYMKLTLQLRMKNSERGDETSDFYSLTTDSDSEEEISPQKQSYSHTLLQCKDCSKLLRGAHSLKNHCKRKHGNNSEKNVLCDKCPNRFYTDFEFNRHYQTHYSVKNYLCHLCSKKFFQKSSLELHLRYHKNDRRYQCETCRKKFFTNNHLKRHRLTHTNRRDFKCEPCARSFRYKDHLRRHMQSVHIGVRSHYCRECDRSFMYLSQLKFHQQIHTGMPYKCQNCSRGFKKRISLKVHLRKCKI